MVDISDSREIYREEKLLPAHNPFERAKVLPELEVDLLICGMISQTQQTALEAAGRIHTDMERGFIRAEAISWEELMEIGSFAEAKKRGRLRSEGKGYRIQDGDVVHFLFNV